MPVSLGLLIMILVGLLGFLGGTTIIKSEQKKSETAKKEAETKRANELQKTLDQVRKSQVENQQFFDLIRQLTITQNVEERNQLLDQLRRFQFGIVATTTTTTTTTTRPSTTTTTTRPVSSTTTVSRPPPSSTTTTTRGPPLTVPPLTPSTVVCVKTSIAEVCQ